MISVHLLHEFRLLLRGGASLPVLAIMSIVTGQGFSAAVGLYSEASLSAGSGNPFDIFEPVPGVFVPTMSWLYLAYTLLLPFVFIPSIAAEKERGTLALLLQSSLSPLLAILHKWVIAVFFLFLTMIPFLLACALWRVWGGVLPIEESGILVAGYFLYGCLVIGVSFLWAAVTPTTAVAAIGAIATLASAWILDFVATLGISAAAELGSVFSFTAMLATFERGVFSTTVAGTFLIMSMLTIAGAAITIEPPGRNRMVRLAATTLLSAMAIAAVAAIPFSFDCTESRRNSFPPVIEHGLQTLPPIEIDVFLGRSDSRRGEFKREILDKIRMAGNNVRVRYHPGADVNYGVFIYRMGTDSMRTYSADEREVIPLLFKAAGVVHSIDSERSFEGAPLVVGASGHRTVAIVFYLLLPAILIIARFYTRYVTTRRADS